MKVKSKWRNIVTIDVANRPVIIVEPGEIIEVDDDLGKSLLEQPDRWESASGSSKKSAGKSGEEE